MSDAATTAKSARESLARGLAALQSDPNVPPQLLELAAPIAQAMGALHQIERSGGAQLAPHADTALNNVRSALGQLQAQPSQHPAVVAAMEAVAGSLGMVHALSKMAAAPPPAQGPTAFQRPTQEAFQQPPQPPPQQYQQPPQVVPAYAPPPQQAYQPPPQQYQPPQQAYQPPPQQYQPPQQAYKPPPQQYQPPPQQAYQPPQPAGAPPANPFGATAVVSDVPMVNADLGAHSPTNFYKGLAGNDIIDHGGLFVSTYKIPKIGTPVRLKVSLPGGYEFEANAVVRWSREQSDDNDSPPGFGAQFTEITQEARQLVYRYVRNREPLFHDDF